MAAPSPPSPRPAPDVAGISRRRLQPRRALIVLLLAASATVIAGGLWTASAAPPGAAPATAPASAPASASAPAPDAAAHARAKHAAELFAEAKDFYAGKEFRSARAKLVESLQIDPGFPDAQLLLAVIDQRIANPGIQNQSAAEDKRDPRLLDDREINRVRLLELTSDDHLIRGRIERRMLEKLWQDIVLKSPVTEQPSRQDRERFLLSTNFREQVNTILDRRAQNFYDDIKLTTEPATIARYRTLIQPVVLQSCATSGCHSSQDHNKVVFFGVSTGRVSLAESYTNFYVLSTWHDGLDNLVDRGRPTDSLLLQYLLPVTMAKNPHPRPAKLAREQQAMPESQKYRQVLDWIKSLEYPARDYAFQHDAYATTQPTKDDAAE